MATRKIINIEQNGEKVWPKGHAKATYMSDGSTVEDAINQIGVGGITVESDPIFSASPAASITEAKKAEWNNKVDKVSGKQLSTEDFTTALKTKLEGLNNYDDTEIESAITSLQNQFNTLVSGNASDAINSFNEIIAFLNGIEDSESLDSIIASIEQQIAGKQDKLISGTNIKTINGTSILGSGDIEISGDGDYLPLTGGTITGDLVITNGNGYGNLNAPCVTADLVSGGKFIFDNDYWLRNEGYDLQYCDNNDESVLTLTYKGDGTKFLSDDGTYKSSSTPQIITVTGSVIRLGATESLVFDGRKYVCPTPMYSVELGDSLDGIDGEIPGDYGEVSIIFTASESLSLSIPYSVLWANGQIPVIEEGVSYELSVAASKVNNAFVYKAVLTPFKSV